VHLDLLSPAQAQVGYGGLGVRGDLGYEGKRVVVRGVPFTQALSTHAPARVLYELDGSFSRLRCAVALNDDVPVGRSHAHFGVRVDGVLVASAPYVSAGESPRPLEADISGARTVELAVTTSRWEYCHAVWLDPQVDSAPARPASSLLADCLARVEIRRPSPPPRAEQCIATVVSPGFERYLDEMLRSLRAHGGCPDALLAVFAVDGDAACSRVAQSHGATVIPCTRRAPISVAVKSLLYSAARVIDAEKFLCLDADMLILDDLAPVFAMLDLFPEGSVLACREANSYSESNLGTAIRYTYFADPRDIHRILGRHNGEADYPLVVNDGLFAGRRTALLDLDGVIRALPQAAAWVDEAQHYCWWRNQFIFNLALARLRCGVQLDDLCNVQLHTQDAEVRVEEGRPRALWRGRPVRVLHFCGLGRKKYPQFRELLSEGLAR
jgi:hypothetical protein